MIQNNCNNNRTKLNFGVASVLIHKIQVPSLGEGIYEAKIFQWLKRPTQFVKKQEPLFELSTDKVDIEIPSPYQGYLQKIIADDGCIVTENQIVAYITINKFIDIDLNKYHADNNSDSDANQKSLQHYDVLLSKSSKSFNYIKKHANSDRANLRGPLDTLFEKNRSYNTTQNTLLDLDNNIKDHQTQSSSSLSYSSSSSDQFYKTHKLSQARNLINNKLITSYQNIPQLTSHISVDIAQIIDDKNNTINPVTNNKRSLTSYFIASIAHCLKLNPIFNASLRSTELCYRKDFNIGCAVSVGDLIYTPVVKKAQLLTIDQIDFKWQSLVSKCHNRSIQFNDLSTSTITLSNPGMYGAEKSNALVLDNQVAIINIGAITTEWKPVIDGNKHHVLADQISSWGKHYIVNVGITFDHRLIDGKHAGEFLTNFKDFLENYKNSSSKLTIDQIE